MLMLTGCSRRDGKEEAPSPLPQERRNPSRAEAASGRTENRNNTSQEARIYTNRDDPLFGVPGRPNLSSDFTLGNLYHGYEADARSREVYGLIFSFFDALKTGKDPAPLLHPDYRSFLLRSLKEYPDVNSAIQDIRVGEFLFSASEAGMAQAGVLIFGVRGRARGEIVAEELDRRWYISGVSLDLGDLHRPRETQAELFDPGPMNPPF
jgi:hypothetical protein